MTAEIKPVPDAQHLNDIEHIKVLLRKYGSHVITAALAVLIAVTAVNMLRGRAGRRAAEADRRFSSAQSSADFESVIRDFGKTGVAPLAALSLAKLHFDNGDYEEALSGYDRFLSRWPGHDMTAVATLGRVFCIEARGHDDSLREAAEAFAAFAATNPGHYLAPQAVLGQARCLEQRGDLEGARTIYEDFIAANPENLWTMRAEELLSVIQSRLRRDEAVPES